MFPYFVIAGCSAGFLFLVAIAITWLTLRGRSYDDPAEYSRHLAAQNWTILALVLFILVVLAVIEWRSERFHDGVYGWQERWAEKVSSGGDATPWGVKEVGDGGWSGQMSLGLYGSVAAGVIAGLLAGCSLLCIGNIRTPGFAWNLRRIL